MHTDEITGVVIDIGNTGVRAGYSGEDTPKPIFPSVVGVVPEEKMGAITDEKIEENMEQKPSRYFIGDQVKAKREYMDIHVTNAQCDYTDYDLLEKLISDTYKINLDNDPSMYPLLMSEPSLIVDKRQRERLCKIAFESLKVPGFYIYKSGALSVFASGRSTSLVLDSGATHTTAVPVHDGYVLQKSVIKYALGGEFLTESLLEHVEKNLEIPVIPRHYLDNVKVENDVKTADIIEIQNMTKSFDHFSKIEIIRDMKENVCRLLDPKGDNAAANIEKVEYELPDGKKIDLGDARFSGAEVFFNIPDPAQKIEIDLSGFKGYHQMILESINKCDVDLRKEMLSNIILTGGNTLIPGFVDAIQKRVVEIAPQNAKTKVIAYPNSIERRYSAWLGGSILASLGSFQSLWVSKAEYEEHGVQVIDKKCP